ncbi:MAG: 50S ribosomal protein L15 [Sulfuricurvum sp.]
MGLENIKPAKGSVQKRKRVGRGQGSGMGKTSTRGGKGQTARSGSTRKRNFEGGQTPLARRLPKIGFTSRVVKPYAINVEKHEEITSLAEITIESIRGVHKFAASITKVKLIGSGAKELSSKIKDENVTTSGN